MSEMGNTISVKGMMGDVAILETDKELLVEFHKKAVINQAKSKEKQTPIYDEVDFCKIIRPGEPHSIWDQPARPIDKARFAEHWKRYELGQEQSVESGTPLELLFANEPGVVANLKAIHVRTVQQLAKLSDNAIGNLPFGHDYRERARKHMNALEKSVDVVKLEQSNADLARQVQDMAMQIAALSQPRKPGRPKKAATNEG